jgi:glutathione synthase
VSARSSAKGRRTERARAARPARAGSLRLLWITDPWRTLDHPNDTTLRLIEAALARGHECHWADVRTLAFAGGPRGPLPALRTRRVLGLDAGRTARGARLAPESTRTLGHFDRVLYRTDPPVDLAYLQPLQLMQAALPARGPRPEFVSPLEVLLAGNEKLEAAALPRLMPPTFAAADVEALEHWGRREGRAVLKPLHQAQSKGVELLRFGTPADRARSRRALRAATDGGRLPVLLQRYLPGILRGETRLWFANGRLLACARKLPRRGHFRIDMDRGGSLAPHTLTAVERRAAVAVGRHLRTRRIRLAAVDLINGLVTDFNFTSPGLIVGMERVLGRDLAGPIIDALARTWR